MEIEVAVTVKAIARVVIDANGEAKVVAIDIKTCQIDGSDTQ